MKIKPLLVALAVALATSRSVAQEKFNFKVVIPEIRFQQPDEAPQSLEIIDGHSFFDNGAHDLRFVGSAHYSGNIKRCLYACNSRVNGRRCMHRETHLRDKNESCPETP